MVFLTATPYLHLITGPAPVYIGFGSLVGSQLSSSLSVVVLEAVQRAGVRALVGSGWAGFAQDVELPPSVIVVGDVPHEWLFERWAGWSSHVLAVEMPAIETYCRAWSCDRSCMVAVHSQHGLHQSHCSCRHSTGSLHHARCGQGHHGQLRTVCCAGLAHAATCCTPQSRPRISEH
jgi:hypothetical protein